REYFQQRALDTLALLVGHYQRRGEYADAIAMARRMLAIDPLCEEAHRDLMRLLAISGQRSAALVQYERCCRVLSSELGIAPEEETSALYQRIVDGELSAPEALALPALQPAHKLRVPSTPLIGRAAAVAALTRRLRQTGTCLLTLTGPPGIGKTRLALEVARVLEADFDDGVCFVGLSPIRHPALVRPAIAQALGLKATAEQPGITLLKSYLADRSLLLLLDNFEQVVAAARVVTELLDAGPRIVVLATSRVALRLGAERQFPVPPLALPRPDELRDETAIAEARAVALFVERAQAIAPDFTIERANAAAIAQICARLDGLPLAIELAAARSKLLSPQALLKRLDRRLPLLTGGALDAPAGQQTLRAAIAWSYDLLDAGEQELFTYLGVFVGGCTLAAAEAVCGSWELGNGSWGAETITPPPISHLASPIVDRLAALIDKSLLNRVEDIGEEPRFLMLETIQEYALERLEASGAATLARRRHAQYYLRLACEIDSQIHGPWQIDALARLEVERDNLRGAMAWCLDDEETSGHEDGEPHSAHAAPVRPRALSRGEIGLQLARALWWAWYVRGNAREAREWLNTALQHPDAAGPTAARARALVGSAFLTLFPAHYTEPPQLYDEVLAIGSALNDLVLIAWACYGLGRVAWFQGDVAHSIVQYEVSLALFRRSEERLGAAWALARLGEAMWHQGEHTRSIARYE